MFRQVLKFNPDIEIVAINDLAPAETLAHLLQFDSVHGRLREPVSLDGDTLIVGERRIRMIAERDLSALPWGDLGVDVVAECTGLFTARADAAKHLDAGARKVVISAPGKEVDLTVCLGINTDQYDAGRHDVISNASCTTNCLAPIAKVLHETFGIENGLMTTVHSYTNDQRTLDLPHKDLHRARAAAVNMIPTSTGAAKAIGLVMPELAGKLHGIAVRVPTPNVSLVDLVVNTTKPVSVDAVHAAMREAASGPLKGILDYEERPLVSSDFNGCPASCTYDATQTAVIGDRTVKVLGWYDNETGYSTRLMQLLELVGKSL
ncbi:MAG: type I glyceraldehyde-3-phosphate dehydrogenase [Candidatus Dadabacteria bacterium]|nr:MAG: type I glyceraldehyde-3-phosphate dehydrogenase [Candidatus Dadabacteria bacterium]